MSDLLQELLAIEHQGWESLCEGTGGRFYGDVMTEDALMVLANGAIMDRSSVTAALGQAPPWLKFEITKPALVRAGNDVAALVYTATAYRDGETTPFVGAMSSVYHRTPSGWRLVLYQQTAVP